MGHKSSLDKFKRIEITLNIFSKSSVRLDNNWGQGWLPRGATPCLRSGEVAQQSNPTSKQRWLCGHRSAQRSYSTFKVRRGGGEEIPLVQGKEQRLRFAGAAVKRYPMFKVRETQVRR